MALLAVPGCELSTDGLPPSEDHVPPVEPNPGTGGAVAQQALLKASNTGPGDRFGWSVALSHDTLAVGASLESSSGRGVDGEQQGNTYPGSGAVYIFRRSGEVWQQEAYLKASNAGARDRFGWSVALDGDMLAVGAIWEDSVATGVNGHQHNNRALDSGAVYVFRRTGGHDDSAGAVWQQEAYLKASNTGAGDHFGYSLALSGDTLAVGAYREDSAATGVDGDAHDDRAPDSGAVYVFRRAGAQGRESAGAVWQQEAYLKASNAGALDELGRSVTLDGDLLAVGAIYEDGAGPRGEDGAGRRGPRGPGEDGADDSVPNSGAVYVFRRSGELWRQEAYLKASNADAGDWFGRSVALQGDTLAVSALLEDSGATGSGGDADDDSAPDSGAVYVFQRSADGWQEQAYLKASNTHRDDRFGMSVALDGDLLGVGAVFEAGDADDVAGVAGSARVPGSGAVYLFSRAEGNWQQEAYLKASNADTGDELGYSLALSQGVLAVGAIYEDSGGAGFLPEPGDSGHDNRVADSGAVYLFW